MQSMQRQFGKLLRKGPGDNAKVSVLLKDYEDADKVIAQILENARLWKDSWDALMNSQLQIVTEFESLYDPVVGATDGHGREAIPTPKQQLARSFRLREVYSDLRTELLQDITAIEERIIRPGTDARTLIAPIRKTIKKRENKRLDYEKAQDKVTKLQRKPGRTPKEDASLSKYHDEMTRAADEFGIADEHLRQTLPPLIQATFNLVPPLVENLVLIQNRLLGMYYTALHDYCEEVGFPSPPPPMDEVIATWNAAFGPVKSQIEQISFLRAKANLPPPSNGIRRAATGLIPSSNAPKPRAMRIPSGTNSSLYAPTPTPQPDSSPSSSTSSFFNNREKRPDWANPTDFTTATHLGGGQVDRSRNRSVSPNNPQPSNGNGNVGVQRPAYLTNSPSASALQSIAGKKKPPPPPPPVKRKPEEFVVALYDFTGQGQGDLSFKEGDRIKIVEKTQTDQDWWKGELNGVQGSFPANYCKPF
ncbi:hypothetical protein QBC35DRAFT_450747 [Podospora australis]|uniref:Regulator of cytoskeleton and endocytosis n=1 Tax=Podospora australis TaxID=1536484 RepID=A0AAN7AK51_9PEZI|nr:hypothetical protein QBC35DRAFT_450747 [Podospora australis]